MEPATTTTSTSSTVRTWCILAHATALVGFLVPVAGHIVGPLIVWLAKRQDSPEIDAHGKESMNFQISMLIWNAIAAILIIVLIGVSRTFGIFRNRRSRIIKRNASRPIWPFPMCWCRSTREPRTVLESFT